MEHNHLIEKLGTYIYDTYGDYFRELIAADLNVGDYYDEERRWGDVSRVLAQIAVLRGASSYKEYLLAFENLKREEHDSVLTPVSFARLTGIKKKSLTQNARTKAYRLRLRKERDELRELVALNWIDNNLNDAKKYIDNSLKAKKPKRN